MKNKTLGTKRNFRQTLMTKIDFWPFIVIFINIRHNYTPSFFHVTREYRTQDQDSRQQNIVGGPPSSQISRYVYGMSINRYIRKLVMFLACNHILVAFYSSPQS